MGEAFITRGGYLTANPSLNIIEDLQMTVWHDRTTPTIVTKTYTLESAPSYITVTSNGTNSISGVIYDAALETFNLPISVSNGTTVKLVGGGNYADIYHRIDITLSGNLVILKHSAMSCYTDEEGNPTSGGSNAIATLNLFVVGTM